jgi:phage tail-like protein
METGNESQISSNEARGKNYVSSNRFYIEVDGKVQASFSECSSIGMKIDSTSYLEGGVNEQSRLFLNQVSFDPVTLKRGITNDVMFWAWLQDVLNPTKVVRRHNINILTFNQAGETMQSWTLIGAVPVAWKTPAMQASSTEIAVEEVTLSYEGLQVSSDKPGNAPDHGQLGYGRDQLGYFTTT